MKIYKLDFDKFSDWMCGQTVGMKNGEIDYYDCDVDNYIDWKTKGIAPFFDQGERNGSSTV